MGGGEGEAVSDVMPGSVARGDVREGGEVGACSGDLYAPFLPEIQVLSHNSRRKTRAQERFHKHSSRRMRGVSRWFNTG